MKQTQYPYREMSSNDWEKHFYKFRSNSHPSESSVYKYVNNLLTLNNTSIITYIHDFCSQKNVYVSKNYEAILGHPAEKSLTVSSYIMTIMHPDDLKSMYHKAKQAFECISRLDAKERTGVQIRFNYRVIKPDGGTVRILDNTSLEEFDEHGKISLGVGYMVDITRLMPMSSDIYGEIQLPSGENILLLEQSPESYTFSKREMEIIQLIEAGLSSKQVASELKISVNTVHNHRQKMMLRFNCHNMIEVIKIAKQKRYRIKE